MLVEESWVEGDKEKDWKELDAIRELKKQQKKVTQLEVKWQRQEKKHKGAGKCLKEENLKNKITTLQKPNYIIKK